jgi:predicted RNA-binding Zn-ribbon protein involved in translation (DUF1610 family)
MWGKIDDDTYFHCGNCGRKINPYGELNMIGVSPEEAFNMMPACPECGQWKWEYHN